MGRRQQAALAAFADLDERPGSGPDDLADLSVILEYVDGEGAATTREVRIIRYYDDRKPLLWCWCALREDARSFLVERIHGVIDADGVVETAETFLARFGVHPVAEPAAAATPAPVRAAPDKTKLGPVSPAMAAYIAESNSRAVTDITPQGRSISKGVFVLAAVILAIAMLLLA